MLDKLFEYLNVKEEERAQVWLMLGAGFFMGIFLATYGVVAETLFLNTLGIRHCYDNDLFVRSESH